MGEFRPTLHVVAVCALCAMAVTGCGSGAGGGQAAETVELLNASYDPTRELWKGLNETFISHYHKETGKTVAIKQSHGASASQARAIIDGLEADVATLSIWSDTDALRKQGLLKDQWEEGLPNRSLPYTSTVVFVVRKGNPKAIKAWSDLSKADVVVVTPNPKTSGNGRLSFLAAWGSVVLTGGTEKQAREFVTKLYRNVPVLDTGARGSTATFAMKGIGDVHLTMESEAHLEVQESKGELEVVYPPLSILHEPHVTLVDKVVDRKKTRSVAEAYLKFLYTPVGQEIIAKNYYRPTDGKVAAKYASQFPQIRLFAITELVSNWDEAQGKFFAEGSIFDGIYKPADSSNRE